MMGADEQWGQTKQQGQTENVPEVRQSRPRVGKRARRGQEVEIWEGGAMGGDDGR